MGDYGFFDFDEDGDDCSYPHRLVLGTWEVYEAWAFDPACEDTIFNVNIEHKAGAAGLGVAVCSGKEAVSTAALQSLARAGRDATPETGRDHVAGDIEAEPFVVLLEFPASTDSWKATFGRASQLITGRPHGNRAVPWEDREQSSFWLAAYTARDGRFQLEMGVGSHPENRLFRAKFGAGPPPFTHVGLAGLPLGAEAGGEEAEVSLCAVRVQRGLSLDPAPAAGAAERSAEAEEAEAEAEAEPSAEAAAEPSAEVEAADVEPAGAEAAARDEEDMAASGGVFDGFAALASMASSLAEERRRSAEEEERQALEQAAVEELPEQAPPSWRLPGGCEGRAGGVLLGDDEREALLPSLEQVLQRLEAEEEGRASTNTSHYDPRPPLEVTVAAVAEVAGVGAEEELDEGSRPGELTPAALDVPRPPELLAIADHPFVPPADEDVEAQRERAQGLRARAKRLRAEKAKRRDERVAQLRAQHEQEQMAARLAGGVPPKNLGVGRALPGRQAQAASSQRPGRAAVAPWLRDPG